MSYDFDYDPNSGETPWPLVWTVTPEKYNFEGTLGQDFINFTVEAIPDPDYPDAWDDHYTVQTTDPQTGQTTTTSPPPLPPEPILQEYIVQGDPNSDSQILDGQYYTLTTADGLIIDNVDIRLLFPYQSIKYDKAGTLKSANVPQEVIDDDFDFIVEFVPDERQSIEKKITIEAVSDSSEDLISTFWFLLNNDWSEAKSLLKDLADISKQNIQNKDYPEGGPHQTPNDNGGSQEPFDPSGPEQEEETQSFEDKTGMTYDELFRKENPNEINTVIEETGKQEFIKNLKEESQQDPEPELDNPLLNEGSTADEILRNNTITDLTQKYNLTASEVLNLLRQL